MKRAALLLIILVSGLCGTTQASTSDQRHDQHRDQPNDQHWVTAYYLGAWTKDKTGLQPEDIDFSALTHLIFYGLHVGPSGNVEWRGSNILSPAARRTADLAHKAGRKILVGLAGAMTLATDRPHLKRLVDNIIEVVVKGDYDGVDIDWEPVLHSDRGNYTRFAKELRKRLDLLSLRPGKKAHYLLTAAVIDEPALFAHLQSKFDQLNVMTYDLSGDWLNVTWHNSPLFGVKNPLDEDEQLPSVDETIKRFIKAGVAPEKLAPGIDFYGYIWSGGHDGKTKGVFQPKQSWSKTPDINDGIPFSDVVKIYSQMAEVGWDDEAQVPYLSHADKNPDDSFFLSFDDPRSCRLKVEYVREHGLGGIMAWELGGAWLPQKVIRDPLLQSLRSLVPAEMSRHQ